jgi:PPP family 3-phenylpropionic acid transporter
MTRRRLSLLFVMQGIAPGVLLPFLVPILSGRGFGPEGIGLVLGLSAAVTVAAYPVWGYLADAHLGRGWVLRLASLTAAVAGLLFALVTTEPLASALAVSLISVGAAPWGPVADAVALGELGDDSNDYGRIRRWTSLGWVVAALAGGAIYAAVGPAALPVLFSVSALGVGAATIGTSAGRAPAAAAGTEPGLDGLPAGGGLRMFLGLARHSPVLGPFLLGPFVVSAGGSAAGSFLPLRILDTGGGPLLVGVASAVPAIVEIPFFSASGAIALRIGLRGLFAAGIAVSVLQFVVVAVAPDPWVITAVRTVDGAAYALRYAAIVLVVGAVLPERVRAMGQSATWLVAGGIAPILGDPVGGLVYSRLGGPALFAMSAVVVSIGAAIAVRALRGPAFRAREQEGSVP